MAAANPIGVFDSGVGGLLERQADTIVLGCTHYPFLATLIREIAEPAAAIIDPSAAIARELRRRLADAGLLSIEARAGTKRFWSSAAPDKTLPVISQLWRAGIEMQSLPDAPLPMTAKRQVGKILHSHSISASLKTGK